MTGNGRPEDAYLFADPDHGPINVALERFEMRVAKNLAKKRQNWCIEHNVMDQKKAADLEGIVITEEGCASELAFAKTFNLWPDLSTNHFWKFDAILASGLRLDAKGSQRTNGNLIVKASTKRNGTDLFALVLSEGLEKHAIWGYAWASDLLQPDRVAHWLPTPGPFMRRAELFDPRDLFNPDPTVLKARRLARLALEAA